MHFPCEYTAIHQHVSKGASHFLWFESALRLCVSPEFCVEGLKSGLGRFGVDGSRGSFRGPANGGYRASGREQQRVS